jgi:hypothetical protein
MTERTANELLGFGTLYISAEEIDQNSDEFYEKAMAGHRSMQEGRMIPGKIVMAEIREKYGF